jgi:hypothetical protein
MPCTATTTTRIPQTPDTRHIPTSEYIGKIRIGIGLPQLVIVSLVCLLLAVGFDNSRRHARSRMRSRHGVYTRIPVLQYNKDIKQFGNATWQADTTKHISSPAPSKSTDFVDHGRIVQFTWCPDIIKPHLGDWAKAMVEVCLRHPVIWWPLQPGRTHCSNDHLRVSWYCVSVNLECINEEEEVDALLPKPWQSNECKLLR